MVNWIVIMIVGITILPLGIDIPRDVDFFEYLGHV